MTDVRFLSGRNEPRLPGFGHERECQQDPAASDGSKKYKRGGIAESVRKKAGQGGAERSSDPDGDADHALCEGKMPGSAGDVGDNERY